MIVVVDYEMGNVGSILNMFRRIGAQAIGSGDPKVIEQADKLLLPGVGAFDTGMRRIRERNLLPVLQEKVLEQKVPLLGICLGMQLLTEGSEEGSEPGLGWIRGRTVRFDASQMPASLKVPHMGWNTVNVQRESPLLNGMEDECRFYFVHSYHVVCDEDCDVAGVTSHGYPFTSTLRRGNIFGTQFHPEKSHRYGLTVLRHFAELA